MYIDEIRALMPKKGILEELKRSVQHEAQQGLYSCGTVFTQEEVNDIRNELNDALDWFRKEGFSVDVIESEYYYHISISWW